MVVKPFGLATVVASNYAAHARVLSESLRRVHPDAVLTVLVLDDAGLPPHPGVVWTSPAEIGIDEATLHPMAAMYDVIELATALKPSLLRFMLTTHETVLYLDPDIEVFAPLDDLASAADAHGIALTPHRLTPAPMRGRPVDREFLIAGAFNLGFIGVARSAAPFLSWWASHLAADCVVSPEEGLFVDQRWVDLAITYFDHHVSRDPGCNVSWWNLDERDLREHDGVFTVTDSPLRFFHFSGFDPDYPEFLYHRELHHPHPVLVNDPAVKRLVSDHAGRLENAGWGQDSKRAYAYAATATGEPLTRAVRRAYRAEHVRAVAAETSGPPDPFDRAQAAAFTRWAKRTRQVERVMRTAGALYRSVRGSGTGAYARYARMLTGDE